MSPQPGRDPRFAELDALTLNTNQMAMLSGVSLRQLQYWDEQNILPAKIVRRGAKPTRSRKPPPHGSRGDWRTYTYSQGLLAMIIAALKAKGLSLRGQRSIMWRLREIANRFRYTASLRAFIICREGHLELVHEPSLVVERVSGSNKQLFIVDIVKLWLRFAEYQEQFE